MPPSHDFDPATSRPPQFARVLRLVLGFLAGGLLLASAQARSIWEPIPAADLAAKDSASSPGADIEILLSRHVINTRLNSTYSENYNRAKIYTPKGVEQLPVLAITHGTNEDVTGVNARIVKPNGTVIDLPKAEFHESTLFQTNGFGLKKITLAFPGVAAGDIIEYQWKQEVPESLWSYYRFYCQAEDVFTREYRFEVKDATEDYYVRWANCHGEHEPKSKKVVVRNLPPFHRENYMPAESEFRGWVLLSFTHPYVRLFGGDLNWTTMGDAVGAAFEAAVKPTKPILAKVRELTGDRPAPQVAIARLYQFVQHSITNLDHDHTAKGASVKKSRRRRFEDQTPAETLERQAGNSGDILVLFGALCRAANFDPRLGMSAPLDEIIDMDASNDWMLASRREVAVEVAGMWRFYDPANPSLPCGVLGWKDEGASARICPGSGWITIPVTRPEGTQLKREAHLTLAADGTATGEIQIEMTGHHAIAAREKYSEKSNDETLQLVRAEVAERFPAVELSDLKVSDPRDVEHPFTLHYKVRIPGYAEESGSRLLVPADYFTVNQPNPLPDEQRRYPLFLQFAQEQHDHIELTLPAGLDFQSQASPAWVGAADQPFFARYKGHYEPDTRAMTFDRDYVFGVEGHVSFPARVYGAVREVLEQVRASDSHVLVFEKAAPEDPVGGPGTAAKP